MERSERVSMERSEGVSVALAHIMKLMDRSGERLLGSFTRFEDPNIRVESTSKAPEPVAGVPVVSKVAAA
jgi:hypothetical protein